MYSLIPKPDEPGSFNFSIASKISKRVATFRTVNAVKISITIPLIFALKEAKKSESRRMIRKIKNKPDKHDLNEIIAFVKDHGGVEYAAKTADEYSEKAIKSLERYPDTPYKRSLTSLVEFVTTRES